MALFNFSNNNKNQTINVNGYIIIKDSGKLINAPIGLSIYEIPPEVKIIELPVLNSISQSAIEVNFQNNYNIISLPFCAFTRFNKLKRVLLPPNLKKMDLYFDYNILNKMIEIVLPSNLEQFAQNQFSPNTIKLELEDTITSIKGGIVSHNNVLNELIVPGKIQKLEKYCINQSKNLEKLWLKEGIIVMDKEAIRGCNNLIEIHIPSSLKKFILGKDDYRSVKGIGFNHRKYEPSIEQIEEEKNRTIKIYKMIDGDEILFEVNRNGFESLQEYPNEFIFEGNGNSYRLNKKLLGSDNHFIVDIAAQKVYKGNEKIAVGGNSTSFVNKITNNINVSGILHENLNEKEIIEKLLKTKINANKKVKDQLSGDFKVVTKTQKELSDEMASLLEELEEDEYVAKLDSKSLLGYSRNIKSIYCNLISNAPVEPQIVDNLEFDTSVDEKLKMAQKYDMPLEEIERILLNQYKATLNSEQIEFNDIDYQPRRRR